MQSKIWLSSPHMGKQEFQYVKEAFETNWIAPLGPHVDGFEQDIAQYLEQNVKVAVKGKNAHGAKGSTGPTLIGGA